MLNTLIVKHRRAPIFRIVLGPWKVGPAMDCSSSLQLLPCEGMKIVRLRLFVRNIVCKMYSKEKWSDQVKWIKRKWHLVSHACSIDKIINLEEKLKFLPFTMVFFARKCFSMEKLNLNREGSGYKTKQWNELMKKIWDHVSISLMYLV